MAAIELEAGYAFERPFGERHASTIVGELYERHHRMVRALCRLLLRNASDTDDAVQQTFLSAYRSLLSGTQPECPEAWLAVIARRECWARTEKRMRQPIELDESVASGEGADVLSVAIQNADLAAMWDAIRELPSQQRQVFLLREFSGLSYDEVGKALGASASAVDALLVRARRQLRGRLEPLLKVANAATLPYTLFGKLRRLAGSGTRGGASAAKVASVPLAVKVGAVAATGIATIAGSVTFAGRGPSDAGASAMPPTAPALQVFESALPSGPTPSAGRTATDVSAFLTSLGDFAHGATPFGAFTNENSVATAAPTAGSTDAPAADGPIEPGPGETATPPDPGVAEPSSPPAAGGDPQAPPTGGGEPAAAPPTGPDPAAEPTPGDNPAGSNGAADPGSATGSTTGADPTPDGSASNPTTADPPPDPPAATTPVG